MSSAAKKGFVKPGSGSLRIFTRAKEEFQKPCPAQLGENAHGSQPLDMAASFVAGGVLQAALFTQLVWERIHDIRTGVAQDLQERKQLRTRWSRIGFQILRLGFNGRLSSRRHTNTGLNPPGG